MQKTQSETGYNSSATAHRGRTQASSTLNRRYVKRPGVAKAAAAVLKPLSAAAQKHQAREQAAASKTVAARQADAMKKRKELAEKLNRQRLAAARARQQTTAKRATVTTSATAATVTTAHPVQTAARARMTQAQAPAKNAATAKELKEKAIKQALASVAGMDAADAASHGVIASSTDKKAMKNAKKAAKKDAKVNRVKRVKRTKVKQGGGGKRFIIAFACAAACVLGIAYLVNANVPDVSVKVAAMQTGIDASYPSYVPRDYALSNVLSEDGKITMEFAGPDKASFVLTEEKSSWDSAALLSNSVKSQWGDDYTATHEEGITIYIHGSDATWVNGGILFTLDAENGGLTKKQIRNIATSM